MKKEKKFKKIVRWEEGEGWLVVLSFIILFPLFCIPLYIARICDYVQENREVYWKEEK